MWPIALMIGIDLDECQEAAKLIGYKIFATEILAYQELGKSANVGKLNVSLTIRYRSLIATATIN